MEETGFISDYEEATRCLRTRTTDLSEMRAMMRRLEKEGRLDMLFGMMSTFLRRGGIQDDELDTVPVIHIAGTKGKGSTSAFTESILRHHGYQTGLFTSPHMYQIRERICINGRPISRQKFCHYFWEVFKKFEDTMFDSPIEEGGTMPGFFDLLTVMAMRVFISERVDVIVLEVGKGGYTDRTNFVRQPVVCGITSLALEHTESLGSTIDKIAWHKAGIIKSGRPVITLPQDPQALQVILDIAREKQAPVYIAMPLPQSTLDENCFSLGIKGPVQVQNAGLAVQLFRAWETWKGVTKPDHINGVTKISCIQDIPRLICGSLEMNIIKGLSSCRLHGRTEIIRREHVTYYLDFAHTQESMEHCTAWFRKASSLEAASMSGNKIARVLQFYCLSVKEPQKLLPILKDVDFDGATFCWCMASSDEPLGQHSDQRYAKVLPDLENALVEKMKSVWESLPSVSQDVSNPAEPVHSQSCLKHQHTVTNGLIFPQLKPSNLHRSDSPNENEAEHITTNGCDSHPNETNLLANGDGVHIDEVFISANEHASSEILTNENGIYFPNLDTADRNHKHMLNGKTSQNGAIPAQGSATFDCALQALVWATQGKDPSVANCMRAPRELLPLAPLAMREADHIQVLVTGSSKLVGVVLSVLLPNMND